MNNIMRTVISTAGSFRILATLGATLALAACGSSQNWDDEKPYVTVGGTVSGFTGGTLALWNNGGDRISVLRDGSFTFPLQIANGSDYAVVVATQPAGMTCTVANGIGTASGDVSNVAVTCRPETFTLRPLPAVYSTGKAVNYSPYRTPGGPRDFEVPTDAQVLEDLGLLHTAGFNLLRLFGAETPATDVVAEKILRLAAQNYPEMKFQLGLSLGGLTSCSDTKNDQNIAYLISKTSKYPNVVAISVGNETSFFSKFMPLPCLESYIRTIRSQVTQPVTTNDDWTFWAGKSAGGGDRVEVRPDTILPLIDFVATHMYPISYTFWDWQQVGVPAGPERARAMMENALATAKGWFGEVAAYRYVGRNGVTVSIGDSLPIVIGETGWKAVQTNPASEIEQYAALPPNAKWYWDLLYGNPGLYPSWQGSTGGPVRIFWFQSFDEQWKGIDDGWGLWDLQRKARYTLCGNPAGPACNADIYAGAGYYNPPPFSKITFDSASVTYSFQGFAGAEDAQVVADPVGGTNKVARVNRSADALEFAGTVVGTSGGFTVGIIPFDANNTRMSVRVYSPAAGIRVRLKVEDAADSARSVETDAFTTKANAWETLTFDFANPASGPALNPDFSYNKLIVFFNFGVTGAVAGAQTYYFDDVDFIGGGGLPSGPFNDLSFDSPGVVYTLTGFNGAEDSSLQLDPTDASNTVVRVNRSATADTYAGTVVSTGPSLTVGTVPFTATNTRMSVRVYSPAAGIPVRLKLEDAADPATRFVETEAVTTVANGWQTLVFDFANPAPDSPALNLAYNYNRLIIFFNFGKTGAQAGAQTYYFDDVTFVSGGATAPTDAPTTVIPGDAVTIYSDAASVTGLDPFPDWGQNPPVTRSEVTIAGNKSLQYVWAGPGGLYQGLDWSANPVDVSTKGKLHIDFWSPDITSVKVSIISAGKENAYTQALTTGGWNGVDIDLSNYTEPDKTAIIQIKLEPATPGTLYVDNIHFWGTTGGGGATAPTDAPTTVIPGDAVTIYSDAASVTGLDPFPDWGQNPPVTRGEVTIAGNKSLQYAWAGPGGLYQGLDWASNPVDVSAKGKLHIDFWTPDVASVKVSIISAGLENAVTQVLTTGNWNSVDIDLSNYSVPNLAAIIQIKLEPSSPGTLYVDNIYFWGTGSGNTACTGGTFTGGVFAADYRGSLNPADGKPPLTTLCGDIGFFYDPRFAVGTTALYDFGGISNQIVNPGGINNFYYGFGLKLPAITDGYFGAYVNAPANGIANVSSFTNLKFTLWGPAELFEKSFTPQIQVVMAGPAVAGCGSNSGRSEVQAPLVTAQKIGAASNYVVPLSSFTIKFACSGESTVAQILAKVAQVTFTLVGTNIQYSVPDTSTPPAYSNGLNVGPITFE